MIGSEFGIGAPNGIGVGTRARGYEVIVGRFGGEHIGDIEWLVIPVSSQFIITATTTTNTIIFITCVLCVVV